MATIAERSGTFVVEQQQWSLPPERPWPAKLGRVARQNPVGALAFLIVAGFIVLGLVGPSIAPHPPRDVNVAEQLEGPSMEHPFGTDNLGQDMFSRVIVGARVSMKIGLIAVFIGFIPGALLGVASGFYGRWTDYLIQRSGEAWAAFPQLFIYLTFIAAFGQGFKTITIAVAIGAIFGGSRLLRAVAIVLKQNMYIEAARSVGASEHRIFVTHIIPNVMPYVIVGLSGVFAGAILAEATLSFLGLGLPAGTPGWGIDISSGVRGPFGKSHPYLVIFPGLAISLVVFGFNLLGDTLRDILDPRLRGSR